MVQGDRLEGVSEGVVSGPRRVATGQNLPSGCRLAARKRLGGLHHDYGLERAA